MNRSEFIKRLHPAITHINASDNMSEETLDAINAMVDKVYNMTEEEVKVMGEGQRKFREYEAAIEKESKHYPLLKKVKRFNYETLKAFYERGYSPTAACNAMVEAT